MSRRGLVVDATPAMDGHELGGRELAPSIMFVEAGDKADTAQKAAHALAAGLAEALKVSADGRVGLGVVGGEAAEALDYLGEALDAARVPRHAVVAFQFDERRNKKDQNWLDQDGQPGLGTRLKNQGILQHIVVPEESDLAEPSLLSFAAEYDSRLEAGIPKDHDGNPLYVALLGSGSQDSNPFIPRHVASKFPRGSMDKSANPTTYAPVGRFIEAVEHSPKPPDERVTFGYRALAGARSIVVPYGSGKKSAPLRYNMAEIHLANNTLDPDKQDTLVASLSPAALVMVWAGGEGRQVTIVAGEAARQPQQTPQVTAPPLGRPPAQPGRHRAPVPVAKGEAFTALRSPEVPRRFRIAVATGYAALILGGAAYAPIFGWTSRGRRFMRDVFGQGITDIVDSALFARGAIKRGRPPVFYNKNGK